jgi:hypothetical protein
MLLPPRSDMMTGDIDHGRWRVTNNGVYNGKLEDCFSETSLHLSFTDYRVPFFDGASSGQHDIEFSVLESVISVHDRGEWVGDIDILNAMTHPLRSFGHLECKHQKDSLPEHNILEICCWDDVLDWPNGVRSLVKAHNNWVARLAIASLLIQNIKPGDDTGMVRICSGDNCITCMLEDQPTSGVHLLNPLRIGSG